MPIRYRRRHRRDRRVASRTPWEVLIIDAYFHTADPTVVTFVIDRIYEDILGGGNGIFVRYGATDYTPIDVNSAAQSNSFNATFADPVPEGAEAWITDDVGLQFNPPIPVRTPERVLVREIP